MSVREQIAETNNSVKVSSEILIETLLQRLPQEARVQTDIKGLTLSRWNSPCAHNCFVSPSIMVVLQGHKVWTFGDKEIHGHALDCVVNGVHLPTVGEVRDVTPDEPMLAIGLDIDFSLASELAHSIPATGPRMPGAELGISSAPVAPDVLDTFVRLMALLDHRESIELMAPLLVRELLARVLIGPQGNALRMIYQQEGHSHQIAQAVNWMKENFAQAMRVEELAADVGMATSTFHREFKRVTSVSPLQYQKRLRLHEAQRLMLIENVDANTAAYNVGYESAQQFNREYKRLFGEPPHRHIRQLREAL